MEARAAGRIGNDEYECYYQPIYLRTLDELVAPVAKPDASHSQYRQALRDEVNSVDEDYRATGDARTYGQAFTNFLRAFTEPVLRAALSAHADIDAVVSDIYARVERLVCDNPERYEFRYVGVAALMTRL